MSAFVHGRTMLSDVWTRERQNATGKQESHMPQLYLGSTNLYEQCMYIMADSCTYTLSEPIMKAVQASLVPKYTVCTCIYTVCTRICNVCAWYNQLS